MKILETRASGTHDEFVEELALQQYRSGKGSILDPSSDAPSSSKLAQLPGVAVAAAFNDRTVSNVASVHDAIDRRLDPSQTDGSDSAPLLQGQGRTSET